MCNAGQVECVTCAGYGYVCGFRNSSWGICLGYFVAEPQTSLTPTCDICGRAAPGSLYLFCNKCLSGYVRVNCSACGEYMLPLDSGSELVYCSSCDGSGVQKCEHGYSSPHTYSETCSTCSGVGTITSSPCTHGYSSSHRYCSHYTNTTLTSHSYCSHGYMSQHD